MHQYVGWLTVCSSVYRTERFACSIGEALDKRYNVSRNLDRKKKCPYDRTFLSVNTAVSKRSLLNEYLSLSIESVEKYPLMQRIVDNDYGDVLKNILKYYSLWCEWYVESESCIQKYTVDNTADSWLDFFLLTTTVVGSNPTTLSWLEFLKRDVNQKPSLRKIYYRPLAKQTHQDFR